MKSSRRCQHCGEPFSNGERSEILHGPASIACHMAGDVTGPIEQQRHCVGVCAYRANVGHVPMVGGCPTGAAEEILTVGRDPQFFESPQAFLKHHRDREE